MSTAERQRGPVHRVLLGMLLAALCNGLLIGGPVASPVHAQVPETTRPYSEDDLREDLEARHFSLTISGGVSKGSYQGGLTYGLTYLMRWANAHPDERQTLRLPQFGLAATTGSSAGNINAILAALSWCDEDLLSTPVDENVFWRIWIPVGTNQLFPKRRPRDPSRAEMVFSRSFFDDELYLRLRRALDRPSVSNCRVPIGLTLTRTDHPGIAELTKGLSVPTMRYVSLARLDAVPDGTMAFRPYPFAGLDTQQFGQLALPVLDSHRIDPDRGARAMMDVSLASSAFPVGFAPVELAFRSAPHGEKDHGFFFDGGVFDNNPLTLARRLSDPEPARPALHAIAPSAAVEAYTRYPQGPIFRILIDEENDRKKGTTGSPDRATESDPDRLSLMVYAPFVRTAITAARTYELEVLSRDLRPRERERLQITTRYHGITGTAFFSFGAFFSYVFREHDLYVGLYDAANHLAQQSVPAPTPSQRGDRVRRLIDAFPISREGTAFLRWLHRREFASGGRCDPGAAGDEKDNVYVIIACATTHWDVHKTGTFDLAPLFDTIASFDVPSARDTTSQSPFLRAEVERCLEERDARLYRAGAHYYDCSGQLLADMMKNSDETAADLLEAALDHVRTNERRVERAGSETSADTYVEASYFLFRNHMMGLDTGLSWDNSSMPRTRLPRTPEINRWRRTVWRTLAPREIYFSMRNGGWGIGYRPRWRPAFAFERTGLGVTSALTYVNYGDAPDRLLLGAGLEWTPRQIISSWPNTVLRNVEARVTSTLPDGPVFGPDRPSFAQSVGLDLSLYLAHGKLRLATHPPTLFRGEVWEPGDNWAFTLGLADVNGITYWLWHLFR